MYIVDNEITITYIIAPTATPLLLADYDIKIVEGDLDVTYTEAAINVSNYTPPSALCAGSITYAFTPNYPGHWKVCLTCGVAAAYIILDKKDFWIFCVAPTTQASTAVEGASSVAPIDCP